MYKKSCISCQATEKKYESLIFLNLQSSKQKIKEKNVLVLIMDYSSEKSNVLFLQNYTVTHHKLTLLIWVLCT